MDKVPNVGGFADRAVPDVNKLAGSVVGEVLDHSERWSIGQKIAGALVSFASAGLLLGIGSPRIVIAAVLGLVGVSFVTVQRRTVEAQNIVLKDPSGHPRILLSAGADGPILALLDEDATPRAMMSCQAGPMISLIDSAARGRLVLASGIGKSEAPVLSLRSADGDSRVHAQVLDNGEGGLEVSGATSKLFATPSTIGFPDDENNVGASLSVSKDTAMLTCSASDSLLHMTADLDQGPVVGVSRAGTLAQWRVTGDRGRLITSKNSELVWAWETPTPGSSR